MFPELSLRQREAKFSFHGFLSMDLEESQRSSHTIACLSCPEDRKHLSPVSAGFCNALGHGHREQNWERIKCLLFCSLCLGCEQRRPHPSLCNAYFSPNATFVRHFYSLYSLVLSQMQIQFISLIMDFQLTIMPEKTEATI